MNKIILALSALMFFISGLSGQKPPIKFGEVDISDLEMTSYIKDTSAAAVILCNYGYFSSTLMEFTHLMRIKILKKEGYVWANRSFPTKSKYNIKGMTINLENGKTIKEKLKSESIFINKITENSYETRIAMPNVKVGSVIDIEFTFPSIPFEWRFQETIPVRYSELIIENSPNLRFRSNFFGYEPLLVSTPTRWVARDMPSFKEEPFINSVENYITKREFDILDFRYGTNYIAIATSWTDINTYLYGDHNFKFFYPSSAMLNDIAKRIKESNRSMEGKLKDAFEAVKIVKWNESERLYTSNQTLNFILKMKIGNSADINSLLLELLKKLNIEAYSVAISTRKNGLISQFSPSMNKLNYLIVLAKLDGKTYLLDASEEYIPYNLLPLRCLNFKGRIIDASLNDWIELKTEKKDIELVQYNLNLTDEMNLKGTLSSVRSDYSAFEFRKKYKKFNSKEEFLDDFRNDKPGLIINSSEIENVDSIYLPINEKYNILVNNQVVSMGDELNVSPLFYHQFKENPFKQEVRKYPVDFGYASEKTIISNIVIPESYSVKEIPASFIRKLGDDAASFQYEAVQSGNNVKITSKLMVNKPIFFITEYSGLRDLYNQMIKKHSEPLILKKK
jgi:hypothetical protein